jgi:hypothetical protein
MGRVAERVSRAKAQRKTQRKVKEFLSSCSSSLRLPLRLCAFARDLPLQLSNSPFQRCRNLRFRMLRREHDRLSERD